MARVTVEDCLKQASNRFDLIALATKRARALEKETAVTKLEENGDKSTVIALREIAEGLVTSELDFEMQDIAEDVFAPI